MKRTESPDVGHRPARALRFALALALSVVTRQVLADEAADRDGARELGNKGYAALDRRDFSAAESFFQEAVGLYRAPTLLLGLARAQVGLGKLEAAHLTYDRLLLEGAGLDPSPQFVDAIRDAKKERAEIEASLVRFVVKIEGPTAPKVLLDGEPIPAALLSRLYVSAQAHVVVVAAEGYESKTERVDLRSVKEHQLLVVLRPSISPKVAAGPWKGEAGPTVAQQIGFGFVGAATAAAVHAAVSGGLAIRFDGELQDHCDGGACDRSELYRIDAYERSRVASFLDLGLVGAFAATGVALWITAPGDATTASRPHATAGAMLLGFGVAGAVLGAASLGLRASFAQDLDRCADTCPSELEPAAIDADALLAMGVGGFGALALGLAVGIPLVITTNGTRDSKPATGAVSILPIIGPDGVTVVGRF